jgi:hypothetical protein
MTTGPRSTDGRNRRPLDEIAADIHKLQLSNLFAIGDFLLEAKEQHPGEFLSFLKEHFEKSVSSAENYMNASRLRTKFPIIGNLKLARLTIYALVDVDADDDATGKVMEAIIAALAERATDRQLKPADAARIIELTRLRAEFGNYPDWTLFALDDVATRPPKPWRDKVIEALKAKRPTAEEAADAIVRNVMREHVADLYGRALPAFERGDSKVILEELAQVPAEDRLRVLDQLLKAERPITLDTVRAAIQPPEDADDTGDDAPAPEPAHHDRGGQANGGQQSAPAPAETGANGGDPIAACLAEVVPVMRAAIVRMDTERRLVFFDELRKAVHAIVAEVTAQDAETDRWAETAH